MKHPSVLNTNSIPFRRNFLVCLVMIAAGGILFLANQSNSTEKNPTVSHLNSGQAKPTVAFKQSVIVKGADHLQSAIEPIQQISYTSNSQQTLQLHLSLLEQGYEKLLAIPEYTARFFKQERIDGTLQDSQTMRIKLRHQPFSVYMKWLVGDIDKEVLFINGSYNDKLIVKFGGWKARMIPTLKLDPEGMLAKRESRYSIRTLGLLSLLEKLIEYRRRDLADNSDLSCRMTDSRTDVDHSYHCFTVEYNQPQNWHDYRKSIIHIDKELFLPIDIRNFTWPNYNENLNAEQLDEETLVEHYSYSDISIAPSLTNIDFDIANQEYHFQR